MLIDTHTHLYLDEFSDGGCAAVERALAAGVSHLVMPNVDLTTVSQMKMLHDKYPQSTSMAMGLHPTEIGESWRDDLDKIKSEFNNGKPYIAVGEIGIDLYWDASYREAQMLAFEKQIGWAIDYGLPVIIHCRNGLDEVLEVLQTHPVPHGVMHSFGGSAEDVERIRQTADFYFGINGIVTFKNSRIRETLPAIGIERILLETDSPYLAPVPHRGKRNESAFLVHTATCIAEAMSLSIKKVADETSVNACHLFNLNIN